MPTELPEHVRAHGQRETALTVVLASVTCEIMGARPLGDD